MSTLREAHDALARAQSLKPTLAPVEVALIDALADRFPEDAEIEDFAPWNDAFSDAMRRVYAEHPRDLDVVCLFAEALMNRCYGSHGLTL